jgi:Flp pilus assembly protein TadG
MKRSPCVARPMRLERGAALVELAVTLPVLVALMIGIADFARVFYLAIELTNAARAAAQYGAKDLGAGGSVPLMRTAGEGSVNLSGITVNPTRLCECANASATVTSTSPTANNCRDAPSISCPTSGTFRVITITVTASKDFTTIASYPGIPKTLSLTRVAVLRGTE